MYTRIAIIVRCIGISDTLLHQSRIQDTYNITTMPINSRAKGHQFEIRIAQELREMGYDCVTSRSESRRLDDAGVDLVDDTPFYFQLKRTERLVDLNGTLASMPKEKTPVVLHKKSRKPALVTMSWEDFKRLHLSHERQRKNAKEPESTNSDIQSGDGSNPMGSPYID